MYAEAPFISRRLVARADGFLSKRCAPAEAGGVIKAVRRGEARYSGGRRVQSWAKPAGEIEQAGV